MPERYPPLTRMDPRKAQRIADHLLASAAKLQELGAFQESKRTHWHAGWWLAYISYARLEEAMKRAARLRAEQGRKSGKANRGRRRRATDLPDDA